MRFEVQTPQGRFEITLPADTPTDQVEPLIARALSAQAPASPPAPAAEPERSLPERAARVAGQVGAGFNARLAQVAGALPDLYNRGLRAVGAPAMPEGAYTQGIQRGINAVVGEPPAADGTAERLARGAGAGIVDAGTMLLPASRVAAATAPAAGAAPSLLNRSATALAAQPVMQTVAGMAGGAATEATDSPVAGMAAAAAVPMLAAAGGRLISPVRNQNSAGRNALVAAAEREGIPVTAGQATGSRFLQNVEAQLEQLPLTAGPQRAIREAQEEAFTRAALRRTGTTASDTSPDTLNAIRARIGGEIGEIANRNVLQVTPALEQRLAQVEDSLRFIPAEAAAPVRARIEQLRGMTIQPQAQPGAVVMQGQAPLNPTIPGASYRMMDSQLGRSIRSTTNGDLRAALGDLRETLRTAMDDSIGPQDAADWARARREYANLMTIANAAGRAGAGAAEGRMSPVALREAVNASTGRGYAFGRGDLNELARIGQGVLRPPPDSGTPGRQYAAALLTGGLASGGAGVGALTAGPVGAAVGAGTSLLLPRLVQALMNTPGGQAYLRNGVVQNPALTQSLAAALLGQQGTSYAVGQAP